MRSLKHPLFISILFFIVYLVLISFHELWRNEVEAWSLTFKSHSLKELFYNSRYEGHPKLWFLLLFAVQMVTTNIFYMKLLHICIASATVYIIVRYSPFTFVQKILLCCGYFFLYEFTVISRNYGIEMTLLFGSIALYFNKKPALSGVAILIFLTLQTNVYAVMVTAGLSIYFVLDLVEKKTSIKKILWFSLVIILGVVVSVVTMTPPPDGGFIEEWIFDRDRTYTLNVLATICRSYLPIPIFTRSFYNSSALFLSDHPFLIGVTISVFLFAICLWLFRKNYKVLLFYVVSTFGVLTFTYGYYFGYMRNYGHLFIIFLACYWLYLIESGKKNGTYFFNAILIAQCVAAFAAVYFEIKYPFSKAEKVVEYVKLKQLDELTISGYDAAPSTTIAGILNKDFYFPQYGRYGTYVIWDDYLRNFNKEQAANDIDKFYSNTYGLAVFNDLLDHPPDNWSLDTSFQGAIEEHENYFIYEVNPPETPKK